MQCRYREKILVCGDWIYGEVHPTWRAAGKRQGKFRETSETQQRLNDRRAELWLLAVAHANFHRGDYSLHLTFADGELPEDSDAFERVIRNFMARLRRLYRKAEAVLKYIIVRAWSGKGRPHLHLILSGGVDRGGGRGLLGTRKGKLRPAGVQRKRDRGSGCVHRRAEGCRED